MDIDVTWNNCLAVCLIFVKMAPFYLVSHVQSSALILQLLWFSSCNIQHSWGWGNRNLYFLMHHEQSLSPCCIGKNDWALATCWGWFPFDFRLIHPSVLAVMNELKGESDDKMLSLFVNLFCKSLWDKKWVFILLPTTPPSVAVQFSLCSADLCSSQSQTAGLIQIFLSYRITQQQH